MLGMTDYPGDRELDCWIEEHIMGNKIVHWEWPCGFEPDGCAPEAKSQYAIDNEYITMNDWYDAVTGYHPIYNPDPDFPESEYLLVVPFYTADYDSMFMAIQRVREAWGDFGMTFEIGGGHQWSVFVYQEWMGSSEANDRNLLIAMGEALRTQWSKSH